MFQNNNNMDQTSLNNVSEQISFNNRHFNNEYIGDGDLHCPDDYIDPDPFYVVKPNNKTPTKTEIYNNDSGIGTKVCGQGVLNKLIGIKNNGSAKKLLRSYPQSTTTTTATSISSPPIPVTVGRYSSMLSISSAQKNKNKNAGASDVPLIASSSTSTATRSTSSRSTHDDESSASSISFVLPSRKARKNIVQNNDLKLLQGLEKRMNDAYGQIERMESPAEFDSTESLTVFKVDNRVEVIASPVTIPVVSVPANIDPTNVSIDQVREMLALQYPGSPNSTSTASTTDFSSVPRVVLQFDPNSQYRCIPIEIDNDANNRSTRPSVVSTNTQSDRNNNSSSNFTRSSGSSGSVSGSQEVVLDSMSLNTPITSNKTPVKAIVLSINIDNKQDNQQREQKQKPTQERHQQQPSPPQQQQIQLQINQEEEEYARQIPQETETQTEEVQGKQTVTLTSFLNSFRSQPWTLTLPAVVEENDDDLYALSPTGGTPSSAGGFYYSGSTPNAMSGMKSPNNSNKVPLLSPTSPLSAVSSTSIDNNTARIEILAAMKELVTKQQEAIIDLSHENTLFKQQLKSYEYNINSLNDDKQVITTSIVSLISQKDVYEQEVLSLKDEISQLRKFVIEMNKSNDSNMVQQLENHWSNNIEQKEMVASPINESLDSRSFGTSTILSQKNTITSEKIAIMTEPVTMEIETASNASPALLKAKIDEDKGLSSPSTEKYESNRDDSRKILSPSKSINSKSRQIDFDDSSNPLKISEQLLRLAYEANNASVSLSSNNGKTKDNSILWKTVAELRNDFQNHKAIVKKSPLLPQVQDNNNKDLPEFGQEVLLHSPSFERSIKKIISPRKNINHNNMFMMKSVEEENDENDYTSFDDSLSFFEGHRYEVFRTNICNDDSIESSLTSTTTSSSHNILDSTGVSNSISSITNSSYDSVGVDHNNILHSPNYNDDDAVLSPDSRTTAREVAKFKSRLGTIQHRRFIRQQIFLSNNDNNTKKKKT